MLRGNCTPARSARVCASACGRARKLPVSHRIYWRTSEKSRTRLSPGTNALRYSLVDLRLVVAIADARNVSRGAARCHLAPSSASLRLRQLEDALGAPLFKREARGVSLTRAGRVMLAHCRACLAQLEKMHADLAPFANGVTSQVRLFATSSAIASFLPDDLGVFLAAHPGVRVSLEEHVTADNALAVVDGRADLGIVTMGDEHPELEYAPYRRDELVVVAPAGAAPSRRDAVRFADCLARPFVSLAGSAIHRYLQGRAESLGKPLDVRIQVSGFGAVVSLVRAGAGVAIVPRSVLRHLNGDGLAVLKLDERWAARELSVCSPRDRARMSAPANSLLKHLRDSGAPTAQRRS
ncbi:MAG: LysR family transcriptional regulator [Burkholderiales bacterium]|nr:LysR family transcriptional regulator [Burkholderiales bacterium]